MKSIARFARNRRAPLCGLLFALAFGAAAWGQGVSGTISGVVTDPTKAPIAAAAVTITNAETNVVVWTGQTNASGVYRAPDLPVGDYTIDVQSQGFKRQHVARFPLSVDQRADIAIAMEVRDLTQSVVVEGAG